MMTTRRRLPRARTMLTLLIMSLVPRGMLMAQQSVPVDHESKHHLVFENAHTRIFDVVVPAGDSTLYHVHAHDYVYVTFGDSRLEAQPLGGALTALPLANGDVRYTKGPITHRVINRAATPFHNLTIEVLEPASVTLAPRTAGDSVLENDRVRVTRLNLRPGGTVARQAHAGPWLAVAVNSGSLSIRDGDVIGGAALKPGWYRWFAPGRGTVLGNNGDARLELVEIEWK